MKNAESLVKGRLKPPKKFFEWCLYQTPKIEFKNKNKAISNERKSIETIRKRISVRNENKSHYIFKTYGIILVTEKRIEVQSYAYHVTYKNYQEHVDIELLNYERFENNEHYKIGKYYERYTFGLVPITYMSGPYYNTKFYDNDWQGLITTKSELKYLKLEKLDRSDLANLYKYRKEIEFLQKVNAPVMAWEVMNGLADMRTLNMKWLKKNKQFIKNNENQFNVFELEKRLKERNGKLVKGAMQYIDYHYVKKIPKCVGVVSFQNWLIKNDVNMKFYEDYIKMMQQLNIPLDHPNLVMPKDLKAAHDNAVDLINQLKEEERRKENEEFNKMIQKTFEKRIKLEMNVGDYFIKLPKNSQEIILEGKALHHCVGSKHFIKDHSEGKTTILFVRKFNDIETPLYTMEFKSNSIVQLRGKHNGSAPKEVESICNEWLERVKGKYHANT